MTEQQAEEIVTFMKAATASRPEQNTMDYYKAALLHLNFDYALQAVTIGTITWRWFPSWAEFKEIYRAQKKLGEAAGEQREELPPEAKRGVAAPEWVWVWSWSRLQREPRNLRSFPQQEGHVDPNDLMTKDEYEELRKEWMQLGSPKASTPLPLNR